MQKNNRMSHSLSRIWVHGIWATKNRNPLIIPEIEKEVHEILYSEFLEIACPARIINGLEDHVHSLFLLNPVISPANVIKQVKGSASHTINDMEIIPLKFCWQTGYAAYSLSESNVDNVYRYIVNQKEIHRSKSFDEELEELARLNGIPEEELQKFK